MFITDYRRYSFLLNNVYIPDSKQQKEQFEKELEKYGITAKELKAVVRKDKYPSQRTDKEFLDMCYKIRKVLINVLMSKVMFYKVVYGELILMKYRK